MGFDGMLWSSALTNLATIFSLVVTGLTKIIPGLGRERAADVLVVSSLRDDLNREPWIQQRSADESHGNTCSKWAN
jgi:hypothetical protein